MSRNIKRLNVNTKVIYGSDHAIGGFIDIVDDRFCTDESEGFLFEWSELFGISTNLIGLNTESMKNEKQILTAVEKYLKSITTKQRT